MNRFYKRTGFSILSGIALSHLLVNAGAGPDEDPPLPNPVDPNWWLYVRRKILEWSSNKPSNPIAGFFSDLGKYGNVALFGVMFLLSYNFVYPVFEPIVDDIMGGS
jgi:hypothetical protein